MPEAKLPPFIKSISGKLGDVVYRVSKKTGKTYVSKAPRQGWAAVIVPNGTLFG